MNTLFKFSIATILLLVISACGGIQSQAESRANELCACAEKTGINESIIKSSFLPRGMDRKFEREFPKLALDVLKKMEEDLKDLSQRERKEYTKAFLKAAIDTPCADIMFNLIQFDMLSTLRKEMEKQVRRNDRRQLMLESQGIEEDFF